MQWHCFLTTCINTPCQSSLFDKCDPHNFILFVHIPVPCSNPLICTQGTSAYKKRMRSFCITRTTSSNCSSLLGCLCSVLTSCIVPMYCELFLWMSESCLDPLVFTQETTTCLVTPRDFHPRCCHGPRYNGINCLVVGNSKTD